MRPSWSCGVSLGALLDARCCAGGGGEEGEERREEVGKESPCARKNDDASEKIIESFANDSYVDFHWGCQLRQLLCPEVTSSLTICQKNSGAARYGE